MTIAELYAAEPLWLVGSVFILSLLIGSFLNVVIHRLPIMMEREWRQQAKELMATTACGSGFSLTPELSDGKEVRLKPDPQANAKYNLVVPRSACPSCGMQITALQNIPVVSWLLLKGKCASCKAPISVRY